MSHCNLKIRNAGMPYPRTCAVCGLGPCRDILDVVLTKDAKPSDISPDRKEAQTEAGEWRFDVDDAPIHEVLNVVGRYPEATAGFPRYATKQADGRWFEFSRNKPVEIIVWAWRPRDPWPRAPEAKQTEAGITRSSGGVFVDLGMAAEEGREVVRRKMAEHASQPTEAQMEAARKAAEHILERLSDSACGCDECVTLTAKRLAVFLATAHREGMTRAAEIARDELVEIYEDSPDIDIECNNLVRRIVSDIDAEVSPHPRLSSQADAEPGAAGANATAASFSGRE